MELQPTAALVLLARLLALPATELGDAVADAVHDNPALERTDAPRCAVCGRSLTGRRCPWCPAPAVAALDERAEASPARAELARDLAAAVPSGLRRLALRVVDELDEHGLLGRRPDELAADLGEDRARVEAVVGVLHDLGPPGVGAADVASSLLAQLEAWDGEPPPPCTGTVLRHAHLLVDGGPGHVAAATGIDPHEVARALAFVAGHLHPRPLDLGPPTVTLTHTVDVAVTETADGVLHVETAAATAYGVTVSTSIRATAADRSLPPDVRRWAAERLRAARTFLQQLDERTAALHRIAVAAVEHQAEFVRRGPSAHRPLTRASLAAAVALHESTVSRAVAGKRVRLPNGTVLGFDAFFGTNVAAKEALRQLLGDGEVRGDAALAAELARRGHPVSRRTVAKYRAGLAASD